MADAPEGKPVSERAMAPLNPFWALVVTVVWVAERVKSGTGTLLTVSWTVVLWLRVPLVAVIVMV